MVRCVSDAQLTALYSAVCYFSAVDSLFTVLRLTGFWSLQNNNDCVK